MAKFAEEISGLETNFDSSVGQVIVTGDFNSGSPLREENRTDIRGILKSEIIVRRDLSIMNNEKAPTFNRGTAK